MNNVQSYNKRTVKWGEVRWGEGLYVIAIFKWATPVVYSVIGNINNK
jgi:hypothetical protein